MRRLVAWAFALLVASGAVFWFLTAPQRVQPSQSASGKANLENGKLVFFAGGCASCHTTPDQPDPLLLGGGLGIDSPAGLFKAPNISPDMQNGIGRWSEEQFATAMLEGVSPDGRHYYPAFPYTTYQNMHTEDVRDLFAFLKTLPSSNAVSQPHAFPLNFALVRRGMGLWKRMYMDEGRVELSASSAPLERGRYLVEALGHCGECHTPRSNTGAIDRTRLYAGAAMAGGGFAPNLTSGRGGLGDWTEDDIHFFLKDGTTPDGDVTGGKMAAVIRNTAQLPDEDQLAVATYLKSLAPQDSAQ